MSLSEYDPLLGWRLRPGIVAHGFNTFDHGIRANGDEREIRKGGILAVGDSFTAGSEVLDWESWPAQVEKLTGIPTINGAAGGWGVDQIVMRIQQLLPIVEPRLILLGILDQDIQRCNFSWGGKPKPYFLVENDELVLKHYPVPIHHRGSVAALWDEVMAMVERIKPTDPEAQDFWADWSRDGVTVANNPTEIACRLIHKLKSATDIPIVMVMQHGAYVCSQQAAMPHYAQQVVLYGESIGIPAVCEFPTLRAMWETDRPTFDAQHVSHPPPLIYGHMSATGNGTIARLIVNKLQEVGFLPAVADAA